MSDENIKKNVREFYDRVGWQMVSGEVYQNAEYEDLRPVSHDYIQKCHLRINRHLAPEGDFLLDAGSGPVQYPEYLTYSEGYKARVCMDISIVAMQEARKRLGEKGRYVVADIAHLPFKSDAFDGIVSLHTIHHVPMEDKTLAYEALYRTLKPGRQMAIVNGWTNAPLMVRLKPFMNRMTRFHNWWLRRVKKQEIKPVAVDTVEQKAAEAEKKKNGPAGTFVQKLTAEWLTETLSGKMPFDIFVWRSVNVAFLRAVIYPEWGGKFWLKVIYGLETIFPRWLGRIGQYPLVVVSKPLVEEPVTTR
ncbi:MAG: class I SAM-dependent methyltransferase [Anaerolineaceae bacterium]|nr:class I SAM-dependent methyltransferase [Anaerolineaceae bacterium]